MLTPEENEELGRIHTLAQFGVLPATMQQRYDELRSRSGAVAIPEPTLDVEWLPAQRARQDALDDLLDLADKTEAAAEHVAPAAPVVTQVALPNTHTSIADMAAFEAQMSGDEYYVASPHTGGFTPSTWYRAH